MQRYDMSGMHEEYWMSACDDGDYVEYKDSQAEIALLKDELAAIRAELNPQPSDEWPTYMAVRAMSMALATEKALADRFAQGVLNFDAGFGLGTSKSALAAYRKARGL